VRDKSQDGSTHRALPEYVVTQPHS
jgi:hypothetical protein